MQQPFDDVRVALVCDWLTSSGGAEQVLKAALSLFPGAPIYTSLHNPLAVPQFNAERVITSYLQRLPYANRRHQLMIPLMPAAFESFDLKGFDAVVSIGNGFSKGVITMPGQYHLSYCQTPPRYLWKLGGDVRNIGKFDSRLRAAAEHRLRLWDVVSSSRPDRMLANSRTVASRISKIYRRQADVLYPPVDTERYLPVVRPTADYFLSVGRLIEYKRIDILIEAALRVGMPLKIVGEGPERGSLERLANGSHLIKFLGRLPDSNLRPLYANASAFLFAAEEDFGIVPVEAMSAGRPVIAYGKGGLCESVIDGETGILYPDKTTDSLEQALRAFRPEAFDPMTVRTHAKQFSSSVFIEGLRHAVAEGIAG